MLNMHAYDLLILFSFGGKRKQGLRKVWRSNWETESEVGNFPIPRKKQNAQNIESEYMLNKLGKL